MEIAKNLEPFVVIDDTTITFAGDTAKEKELNEWLYQTTLELNKYQDMVKDLLAFLKAHNRGEHAEFALDIYEMIKDAGC